MGNTVRNTAAETMDIRVMGRANLVEWNRVEKVGRADSGGIYFWSGERIYETYGNVARYNFIRNVSRGIYLDDGLSGASVYGNAIFQAEVAGIFIGGGRDNRVRLLPK